MKFSNATGFTQMTDTLVINIVSPVGMPVVMEQPQGGNSDASL